MENLRFEGTIYVLGNQAADLDSSVSAISLAALLEGLNPGLKAIPLIQGERGDLRLKPEIPALLAYTGNGLRMENFLSPPVPFPEGARVILVDHNRPDYPGLEGSVAAIVDHHEDEGFLKTLPLRVIRRAGSCATLIAELWLASGLPLPRAQRLMLLAAVAVDTGCLDPEWGKTTPEDRRIYNQLSAALPEDDLRFVRSLPDVKLDLSHLDLRDQLRRDFKDLPLPRIRAGISSVPLTADAFFSSGFFDPHTCDDFMKENCPDLLIVMHSASEPFRRQLSFRCAENEPGGESRWEGLLQNALKSLGGFAERPSPAPPWHSFDQEDPRMSRKVLAPLLKEKIIHGVSCETEDAGKRGET